MARSGHLNLKVQTDLCDRKGILCNHIAKFRSSAALKVKVKLHIPKTERSSKTKTQNLETKMTFSKAKRHAVLFRKKGVFVSEFCVLFVEQRSVLGISSWPLYASKLWCIGLRVERILVYFAAVNTAIAYKKALVE